MSSISPTIQSHVIHHPGVDLSDPTTQSELVNAALIEHLKNDGCPLVSMVVSQNHIIVVSPKLKMTRSGAKLQQANYERAVRKLAADPAVVCTRCFVPATGGKGDRQTFAFTVEPRGSMPIGAVLALVLDASGAVTDTETIDVLPEPNRRSLFGKLAFILSKPMPYNPMSPIYVDFGPESDVPEAIKNGAVPHAEHGTLQ